MAATHTDFCLGATIVVVLPYRAGMGRPMDAAPGSAVFPIRDAFPYVEETEAAVLEHVAQSPPPIPQLTLVQATHGWCGRAMHFTVRARSYDRERARDCWNSLVAAFVKAKAVFDAAVVKAVPGFAAVSIRDTFPYLGYVDFCLGATMIKTVRYRAGVGRPVGAVPGSAVVSIRDAFAYLEETGAAAVLERIAMRPASLLLFTITEAVHGWDGYTVQFSVHARGYNHQQACERWRSLVATAEAEASTRLSAPAVVGDAWLAVD